MLYPPCVQWILLCCYQGPCPSLWLLSAPDLNYCFQAALTGEPRFKPSAKSIFHVPPGEEGSVWIGE